FLHTLTKQGQEIHQARQVSLIQKVYQWMEVLTSSPASPHRLDVEDPQLGQIKFDYLEAGEGKQIHIAVDNEIARASVQKLVPVVQEVLQSRGQQPVAISVHLRNESEFRQHLGQEGARSRRGTPRRKAMTGVSPSAEGSGSLPPVFIKQMGYNTIEMVA
ncbi:MAG: hypothetical protein D6762_08490, partial [Candidatus Neomarinimicrobiota bacterium]